TDLSDKVCKSFDPSDLPGLPIETLSTLANLRNVLIGALVKVADAVRDVARPFGEDDGILNRLRATEDDIKTSAIKAAVTSGLTKFGTTISEVAPMLAPVVAPADPLKPFRIYAVRATRDAVQAVAGLSATVSRLVQEATSLKISPNDMQDLMGAATAFIA